MSEPDRWIVLGSGTLDFDPKRGPSCHLLEAAGQRLLVDSGPGCLQRLAARGLDSRDLDAVVHSHLHLDHLPDLFPLLFHALIEKRERPLLLAGAPGHRAQLEAIFQLLYPKLGGLPLVWLEQLDDEEPRSLAATGLELTCFSATHSQSPRLLRFSTDRWTLTYSGDTAPTPALTRAARGADWLVVECTAPDGIPRGKHLGPTSVAEAVRAARPKAVALVHLSPLWETPEHAAQAVRQCLGGLDIPVVGARDGLELRLPYSHSMVPGGLLEMS